MTTVMHRGYGYHFNGRLRFSVNRFLRLYPSYWVAAVISLFLIIWLGQEPVKSYHPRMFIPTDFEDIARNLLMVFSWQSSPRLIPPTWAITIEIFFYIAICLGISKTRRRTLVWLAASIAYTLFVVITSDDWRLRYFYIPSASLPFAIGSYLYYADTKRMFSWLSYFKITPLVLTALILFNFFAHYNYEEFSGLPVVFLSGFYLNIVLMMLLAMSLLEGGKYPFISKGKDRFLGDFSYPIYLTHWQSGILASVVIMGVPYRSGTVEGGVVLIGTIVVALSISYLMIFLIDRPIERLREKVKRRRQSVFPPLREGAENEASTK